jgi:hypothetical protein
MSFACTYQNMLTLNLECEIEYSIRVLLTYRKTKRKFFRILFKSQFSTIRKNHFWQ